MKKFLNLFEHELKMAKPFLITILALVFLLQLLQFIFILAQSGNQAFSDNILNLSFFFEHSKYYFLIIGAAALAVLIYAIYTWFREWQMDGKFIYRLATLPGSRMPIALAKFFTIFAMIFSLLLLQLFIFFLFDKLAVSMGYIAESMTYYDYLMQFGEISYLIMPTSIASFITHYSMGAAFLLSLFNIIILFMNEKSQDLLRTIIYLLLYMAISLFLVVLVEKLRMDILQLTAQEWWIHSLFYWIYIAMQLFFMKHLLDHRLNV